MSQRRTSMWVSEAIFGWDASSGGGSLINQDRVARPHEILSHAEALIGNATSKLSLADAISNLKRAINSRLQHLEVLYGFSTIFPKKMGALERLEAIGLARPYLVKQLFELRNGIEHKDASPPSLKRCKELLDVTWYFLRTTDYACKMVPDSVVLEEIKGPSARNPSLLVTVSMRKERKGVTVEVAGWLSSSHLSENEAPGFLAIELSKCAPKPHAPRDTSDPIAVSAFVTNSARSSDERWIEGKMKAQADIQQRFWRLALEAS